MIFRKSAILLWISKNTPKVPSIAPKYGARRVPGEPPEHFWGPRGVRHPCHFEDLDPMGCQSEVWVSKRGPRASKSDPTGLENRPRGSKSDPPGLQNDLHYSADVALDRGRDSTQLKTHGGDLRVRLPSLSLSPLANTTRARNPGQSKSKPKAKSMSKSNRTSKSKSQSISS